MKRMCYACEKKPARKLVTSRVHYTHASTEAVFCSRGCAADWALMTFATREEAVWCRKHGWDSLNEGSCGECYDEAEEARRCKECLGVGFNLGGVPCPACGTTGVVDHAEEEEAAA